MDNVIRLPGSGLAALQRRHPQLSYCQVEGTWHGWIPLEGGGGMEAHGRDEAELLDKLTAALDG